MTNRLHSDDVYIIKLLKGKERYSISYDDEHEAESLRQLVRWAANPELSFSWYDAEVLSQKIRNRHTEPTP